MFSANNLSTLFANRLVLSGPIVQHSLVDMHGSSEEEARRAITSIVPKANQLGWSEINFVTGRGNHTNSKGNRGILYHNFSEWLKEVNEHVADFKPCLGFYEVKIKDSIPVADPFTTFLNEEIKAFLTANFQKINAITNKDSDNISALAVCHDNGYGTTQNYKKATELYLELAKDPNVDATILYEIACRYFIGKGVRQNDALAIQYFTRSADQHFVLAAATLGNIYFKGMGIAKPDYELAHRYYAIAAHVGHAESARKLGYLYNNGLGVTQSLDKAIEYWEQAEKLNDPVAAYNLAGVYQNQRKNPEKFNFYLNRSAELGDPDGQFCLGLQNFFGFGGAKPNRELGIKWITDAAKNFHSHAQYILFLLAVSGKNKELAKAHLMAAAQNSHIEAQALVIFEIFDFAPEFVKAIEAEFYKQDDSAVIEMQNKPLRNRILNYMIFGDDTSKAQFKKAIRIMTHLAKLDYPKAYAILGTLSIEGKPPHLLPNPTAATQYWMAGSKLEDVDCLNSLGHFWRMGAGGKVDFKKAIAYFDKAVKKGSAYAHNELGLIYQAGEAGKIKNIDLAVKNFIAANVLDEMNAAKPDNNFKYSAKNLALLCLNGAENFPRDVERAIVLFSQAAEAGSVDSAVFLITYYADEDTYDFEKGFYFTKLAAKLGDERAVIMLKKYEEIQCKVAARAAQVDEDRFVHDSTLVKALSKISQLEFYGVKDEKGQVDACVECTEENMPKVDAFNAYLHGPGVFCRENRQTFFVLPNVEVLQQGFHDHLKNNIRSVSKKL